MSREQLRKRGKHGTYSYTKKSKRGTAAAFLSLILCILIFCFCLGRCSKKIPEPEVVETPEPEVVVEIVTEDEWTEDAAIYISKTLYGESEGLSKYEKSLVAWCILNRLDYASYDFGETVEDVVTSPGQFDGYSQDHPTTDENLEIAKDVIARWFAEKKCSGDVGRTLPKQYIYFTGYDGHNYFRDSNDSAFMFDGENPYD